MNHVTLKAAAKSWPLDTHKPDTSRRMGSHYFRKKLKTFFLPGSADVRALQDAGQPVRGPAARSEPQRAARTAELGLALDAPPSQPLSGRKSHHQGPQRQLRWSGETREARHFRYFCLVLSSK
jgi:hypothetical protein